MKVQHVRHDASVCVRAAEWRSVRNVRKKSSVMAEVVGLCESM